MQIVDCIMFAYEDGALQIRLEELKDVVDHTLIVQANQTFRGVPREIKNIDLPGVTNLVVDLPSTDPWQNEKFQRDSTVSLAKILFPGAVAIVADSDEIPHPRAVKEYAHPVTLVTDYREWFADWRAPDNRQLHHQAFMAPLAEIESAHDTRWAKIYPEAQHRGWHLSSLGGVDLVQQKLGQFSHAEYDTEYWNNSKRLASSLTEGRDLLDRFNLEYTRDLPSCIEKFAWALGGPI